MGERHEQTFLKRRHTNSQTFWEKHSILLVIMETQIHNRRRCHLTPGSMTVDKKVKAMAIMKDVEKSSLWLLLLGMWIGVAIMENSMEGLQKLQNGTTSGSSNPASGYRTRGIQVSVLKRCLQCHIQGRIHQAAHGWKSLGIHASMSRLGSQGK